MDNIDSIDEAKNSSEIEQLTIKLALTLASNYKSLDDKDANKKTNIAVAMSLLAFANSLSTVRDAARILHMAKAISNL